MQATECSSTIAVRFPAQRTLPVQRPQRASRAANHAPSGHRDAFFSPSPVQDSEDAQGLLESPRDDMPFSTTRTILIPCRFFGQPPGRKGLSWRAVRISGDGSQEGRHLANKKEGYQEPRSPRPPPRPRAGGPASATYEQRTLGKRRVFFFASMLVAQCGPCPRPS